MVVHSDATDLHEVLQEALGGLPRQVANDERVGLDVRDQLLLLLEDVLEVMEVTVWVRLLHELPDESLLGQLSKLLDVVPQFLVAEDRLDRLGEDTDGPDRAQQLDIAVVIRLQDVVELLHDVSEHLDVHVLITLQALTDLTDYAAQEIICRVAHFEVLLDAESQRQLDQIERVPHDLLREEPRVLREQLHAALHHRTIVDLVYRTDHCLQDEE